MLEILLFYRSVEQLSSPLESEPAVSVLARRSKNGPPPRPSSGRGGTWGSISRVFARSRHRNKSAHSQSQEGPTDPDAYRSWSPLTEEGYAEKLRLLREAASVPMERWRAPTVLAWLEIALGMPQYGPRCAENVKSGKVTYSTFVGKDRNKKRVNYFSILAKSYSKSNHFFRSNV